MAISDELTKYATNAAVIEEVKQNIKTALVDRGVDMTDVPFTEYNTKISDLSNVTSIYDNGVWNDEYGDPATYIPSGSSLTFEDNHIHMGGGGSVVQIGFTLKDEDVGREVFALVLPTNYNSTINADYRFGVGYQNTALTSDNPGTTTADNRITPYNALSIAKPSIVGIVADDKYVKLFAGPSQTCSIYKIWLGNHYDTSITESEWTYCTGNLVTMTSNSYNGYTASCSGWASNSNAYYAFDGTHGGTSMLYTNNPNETGRPIATLTFPNPIKIAEVQSWIGYGGEAITYSRWFTIYGIKSDGTKVSLGTNSSGSSGENWTYIKNNSNVDYAKATHTVSSANQGVEFVGIQAYGPSSSGYYYLGGLKITKWYE